MKTGFVPAALAHPEIGGIDVLWGEDTGKKNSSYGLAKIAAYHPEMLSVIPELFGEFKVTSQNENTIQLELGPYRAVVRKNWMGNAQNWLLTAFEKKEGDLAGKTMDTPDAPLQGREDGKLSSQGRNDKDTTAPQRVNPDGRRQSRAAR